mgnify:CR=1 FL=1|jgi:hypothetical protein
MFHMKQRIDVDLALFINLSRLTTAVLVYESIAISADITSHILDKKKPATFYRVSWVFELFYY